MNGDTNQTIAVIHTCLCFFLHEMLLFQLKPTKQFCMVQPWISVGFKSANEKNSWEGCETEKQNS